MTRETWTFNLHWQNDEPLYRSVLAYATDVLTRLPKASNQTLGLLVVAEVIQWCRRGYSTWHGGYTQLSTRHVPHVSHTVLENLDIDIAGEWGEIDLETVAEAVREALDLETNQ